jgi:hypothetical protein
MEVIIMQGIEKAYFNACLNAVINAWRALLSETAIVTITPPKYGKKDTLGLDAIPEIIISNQLLNFDQHAILVTEELDEVVQKRLPSDSNPIKQPIMFFSDPTDRSKQLKEFFTEISRKDQVEKIGNLMKKNNCLDLWEQKYGAPADITGATTSITCIRKSEIIFSVILNYITRSVFIAVPMGVYQYQLPEFSENQENLLAKINLDLILEKGTPIKFPPARTACQISDDYQTFVTYLGKPEYIDNFNSSGIFVQDFKKFLHFQEPGGPTRVLYLSDIQQKIKPIGFILANGEKIGEWIPWLAFVKFSKSPGGESALKVYEITIDRPLFRSGILMTPSPAYSIFREDGADFLLDISRLKSQPKPSKFRAMLLVTQDDNDRMIPRMSQNAYREITLK